MIPIPWKVERGHGCPTERPWACVNEANGHVMGCHPTRASGLKQSAALYANTADETKTASSTPTAGGYGIPQPIDSSIALTGQGSTLTDHPEKGKSVATANWVVEKGHGCPASAPWAVVDADGGEVYCCSRSEAAARAQASVAWDSDAATPDSADEGGTAPHFGVIGSGGRSNNDNGDLRATPPADVHADSAHNKADVQFLHDIAGHVIGSLGSAKAVQSKGEHPEVAALAAGVLSTRGHDMTAITNLARRIGVPIGGGTVAGATTSGTSGTSGTSAHGQGYGAGGNSGRSNGWGGEYRTPPADIHAGSRAGNDLSFLHNLTDGLRGLAATVRNHDPQDGEVASHAQGVLASTTAHLDTTNRLLGRISTAAAASSSGSSTTGSSGHGQGGGNAYGGGSGGGQTNSRELVESVFRRLSGQRRSGDDLGDAEFLYGLTAQLREVQDTIARFRSDNPDVTKQLEMLADRNAENIANVRKVAWKLSGGKVPAGRSTTSSPVADFVASRTESASEGRAKRDRAERELLESVLFPEAAIRAMATKKSGGNKQPYGDVAYADPGYQSDKKKRYPIDTSAHIHAAWSYINKAKNAAKYSADQLASIKGRIKSAAKRIGMKIADQSNASTLDAGVYRAMSHAQELRDILLGESGDGIGLLTGHFSVFDTWYRVDSMREGTFLERAARTAFNDTIRQDQDRMRVLFDHGFDPQIGNKVLGPIRTLRTDDAGAYYEVPLFDTSYNRDLLPGLKRGVYGASMRMRVLDDHWDDKPTRSEHNPDGLAERTILKASVAEFGPVTFPASPSASAGVRSMTDYFYERRGLHVPDAETRSLADEGWTADEISRWEEHLVNEEDTDLPGRSDARSADGGDSETGSRSDYGSIQHDEFSDRIDHLWFRGIKVRHASAYERND